MHGNRFVNFASHMIRDMLVSESVESRESCLRTIGNRLSHKEQVTCRRCAMITCSSRVEYHQFCSLLTNRCPNALYLYRALFTPLGNLSKWQFVFEGCAFPAEHLAVLMCHSDRVHSVRCPDLCPALVLCYQRRVASALSAFRIRFSLAEKADSESACSLFQKFRQFSICRESLLSARDPICCGEFVQEDFRKVLHEAYAMG